MEECVLGKSKFSARPSPVSTNAGLLSVYASQFSFHIINIKSDRLLSAWVHKLAMLYTTGWSGRIWGWKKMDLKCGILNLRCNLFYTGKVLWHIQTRHSSKTSWQYGIGNQADLQRGWLCSCLWQWFIGICLVSGDDLWLSKYHLKIDILFNSKYECNNLWTRYAIKSN